MAPARAYSNVPVALPGDGRSGPAHGASTGTLSRSRASELTLRTLISTVPFSFWLAAWCEQGTLCRFQIRPFNVLRSATGNISADA